MKIPLHLKLRKKAHQDIAYAQDIMIEEAYNFFPRAVLHGGTAIWRCYGGNRFSEDIDMYLPNKNNIDDFFKHLESRGFFIIKKRVKQNSLYSIMEFNRAEVRFEAVFARKTNVVLKEYETADGLLINVYTFSTDDLLDEKITTFLKRGKIRDLYDIFFLLRFAENKINVPVEKIIKAPVNDEENLKAIIISGPIPSSVEMRSYIKKWER